MGILYYLAALLIVIGLIINHTTVGFIITLAIVTFLILGYYWIQIYNGYKYLYNESENSIAAIDVMLQKRADTLLALVEVVKKYDIHEYDTIKDTIESRSNPTTANIENSMIRIKAVAEKYPNLKAEHLYKKLMGNNNISSTNEELTKYRLQYNRIALAYNKDLALFPTNIVGLVHRFKKLNYFSTEEMNKQSTDGRYSPSEDK